MFEIMLKSHGSRYAAAKMLCYGKLSDCNKLSMLPGSKTAYALQYFFLQYSMPVYMRVDPILFENTDLKILESKS